MFVKHVWATNFLSGELLTLPVEPLVSRGIWKGNSDGLTFPQVCFFLFSQILVKYLVCTYLRAADPS